MVSIVRRMVRLRTLLAIRIGPGAAILPPEVTRIHMDFAQKINDGHYGPRKFWRTYLPRLKYHNPTVAMTVNRSTDQDGPALMTVHFTDAISAANTPPAISSTTNSQSSTAPVPATTSMAPTERVETISMKHSHETDILARLLAITNAVPLKPSQDEMDQMVDIEERQARSEKDAKRSQAVNEVRRKKEAILAQARGQLASSRQI